jgi:hypothetical protein
MATLCLFATAPGNVGLANFNDVTVLRLELTRGLWVIMGRVVMGNDDGDGQNASARLTTADGSIELDRADLRLDKGGEGSEAAVSLQATLSTAKQIVDIRCATFKGHARQASLIAFTVDQIEESNPG